MPLSLTNKGALARAASDAAKRGGSGGAHAKPKRPRTSKTTRNAAAVGREKKGDNTPPQGKGKKGENKVESAGGNKVENAGGSKVENAGGNKVENAGGTRGNKGGRKRAAASVVNTNIGDIHTNNTHERGGADDGGVVGAGAVVVRGEQQSQAAKKKNRTRTTVGKTDVGRGGGGDSSDVCVGTRKSRSDGAAVQEEVMPAAKYVGRCVGGHAFPSHIHTPRHTPTHTLPYTHSHTHSPQHTPTHSCRRRNRGDDELERHIAMAKLATALTAPAALGTTTSSPRNTILPRSTPLTDPTGSTGQHPHGGMGITITATGATTSHHATNNPQHQQGDHDTAAAHTAAAGAAGEGAVRYRQEANGAACFWVEVLVTEEGDVGGRGGEENGRGGDEEQREGGGKSTRNGQRDGQRVGGTDVDQQHALAQNNPGAQPPTRRRWVHVDPVELWVDRPQHVENALARGQPLSYVIACMNGKVKDVTKRYCADVRATQKLRDESWWQETLAPLRMRLDNMGGMGGHGGGGVEVLTATATGGGAGMQAAAGGGVGGGGVGGGVVAHGGGGSSGVVGGRGRKSMANVGIIGQEGGFVREVCVWGLSHIVHAHDASYIISYTVHHTRPFCVPCLRTHPVYTHINTNTHILFTPSPHPRIHTLPQPKTQGYGCRRP